MPDADTALDWKPARIAQDATNYYVKAVADGEETTHNYRILAVIPKAYSKPVVTIHQNQLGATIHALSTAKVISLNWVSGSYAKTVKEDADDKEAFDCFVITANDHLWKLVHLNANYDSPRDRGEYTSLPKARTAANNFKSLKPLPKSKTTTSPKWFEGIYTSSYVHNENQLAYAALIPSNNISLLYIFRDGKSKVSVTPYVTEEGAKKAFEKFVGHDYLSWRPLHMMINAISVTPMKTHFWLIYPFLDKYRQTMFANDSAKPVVSHFKSVHEAKEDAQAKENLKHLPTEERRPEPVSQELLNRNKQSTLKAIAAFRESF
jgi:hypothetical protein